MGNVDNGRRRVRGCVRACVRVCVCVCVLGEGWDIGEFSVLSAQFCCEHNTVIKIEFN